MCIVVELEVEPPPSGSHLQGATQAVRALLIPVLPRRMAIAPCHGQRAAEVRYKPHAEVREIQNLCDQEVKFGAFSRSTPEAAKAFERLATIRPSLH
jgi:hypothetical protein